MGGREVQPGGSAGVRRKLGRRSRQDRVRPPSKLGPCLTVMAPSSSFMYSPVMSPSSLLASKMAGFWKMKVAAGRGEGKEMRRRGAGGRHVAAAPGGCGELGQLSIESRTHRCRWRRPCCG